MGWKTKTKEKAKRLRVLFKTNGFGLVPRDLDGLAAAGVDSFWLDIKAYDEETYRALCGTTNKWILKIPEWILERGFVLEVLILYIPGIVEVDRIAKIARLNAELDERVPFTILAFFLEYKLLSARPPTLEEMLKAYSAVKEAGLEQMKLGNCSIFARTGSD